jgi:hypothetical protein
MFAMVSAKLSDSGQKSPANHYHIAEEGSLERIIRYDPDL